MSPREPLWDDWRSAEAYREYVESYPLYRALNRRLAELADLGTARRVLDLGCGTGATAAACLEQLPVEGELVAVDRADVMVEIARSRVRDPRVSFFCQEASRVTRSVGGTFDRVVCNAALWLFPSRVLVLDQVREMLDPGGLLVFNLPGERLEDVPPDPFQLELQAALLADLGERRPPEEPRFDRGQLERELWRSGFRLERTELYRLACRQEELMALMQIPAMAGRLAPHLAREEGLELVRTVAARCDPKLEVDVPWIFFVARRGAAHCSEV